MMSRYPGPSVNPGKPGSYVYIDIDGLSGTVRQGGVEYICAAETADRFALVNNVSRPDRPLVVFGPLREEQMALVENHFNSYLFHHK